MLHTIGYQVFQIFRHWCVNYRRMLQNQRDANYRAIKLQSHIIDEIETDIIRFGRIDTLSDDVFWRMFDQYVQPNEPLTESMVNMDRFEHWIHVSKTKARDELKKLRSISCQFNRKYSWFDGTCSIGGTPNVYTLSQCIMNMYHGEDPLRIINVRVIELPDL